MVPQHSHTRPTRSFLLAALVAALVVLYSCDHHSAIPSTLTPPIPQVGTAARDVVRGPSSPTACQPGVAHRVPARPTNLS